jgi:hypothetical protein
MRKKNKKEKLIIFYDDKDIYEEWSEEIIKHAKKIQTYAPHKSKS